MVQLPLPHPPKIHLLSELQKTLLPVADFHVLATILFALGELIGGGIGKQKGGLTM